MNVQILGYDIDFKDFQYYIIFYGRINDALESTRLLRGLPQIQAINTLTEERRKYQKYLDEIKAKYPAEVIEAIEEQVRNG